MKAIGYILRGLGILFLAPFGILVLLILGIEEILTTMGALKW